jgi:hypothetical protein
MNLKVIIEYVKLKLTNYHNSTRDLIETTEVIEVLERIESMLYQLKGEK